MIEASWSDACRAGVSSFAHMNDTYSSRNAEPQDLTYPVVVRNNVALMMGITTLGGCLS